MRNTQQTRILAAVLLLLLPILAFGQSVLKVHGVESYTLTGRYDNALIQLSDIQNLTIKDLELHNTKVQLAGCRNQKANGVYMRGGLWESFPTPVRLEHFDNAAAWWAATNGSTSWIGDRQRYRRIFPGGSGIFDLVVDKDQLKNGFDIGPYQTARWTLQDSAGKTFYPQVWGMADNGNGTMTIRLAPRAAMAPGLGFWSVVNPAARSNIEYSNFDVRDHAYMSVYFANVKLRSSTFGPATLDYNFGMENSGTVDVSGVEAYGNHTPQGNGAALAFLFGAESVTVKSCTIDIVSVSSGGWRYGPIKSESPVSFLDMERGWYVGPITVQGKAVPIPKPVQNEEVPKLLKAG